MVGVSGEGTLRVQRLIGWGYLTRIRSISKAKIPLKNRSLLFYKLMKELGWGCPTQE